MWLWECAYCIECFWSSRGVGARVLHGMWSSYLSQAPLSPPQATGARVFPSPLGCTWNLVICTPDPSAPGRGVVEGGGPFIFEDECGVT